MGENLKASGLPVSKNAMPVNPSISSLRKVLGLSVLLAPLIISCGGSSSENGNGNNGNGDGGHNNGHDGSASALCSEAQGKSSRYMEILRGGELQEGSSSIELVDAARYSLEGPWADLRILGPDRLSADSSFPEGSSLLIDSSDTIALSMPNGEVSASACSVNDSAGQYGDQMSAFLAFSRDMATLFCSPNERVDATLSIGSDVNSTGIEFGDGFRFSLRRLSLAADGSSTTFYAEVLDSSGTSIWSQADLSVLQYQSQVVTVTYDGKNRGIKIMNHENGYNRQGQPYVNVSLHDCGVQ